MTLMMCRSSEMRNADVVGIEIIGCFAAAGGDGLWQAPGTYKGTRAKTERR